MNVRKNSHELRKVNIGLKKKNSVIIKRFSQKSEIITNSLILAINEKREECIACSVREYIQY